MENPRSLFKKVFYYFLSSRALVFLYAVIARYIIPLNEGYLGKEVAGRLPYLAWIWANFDGRHFIEIASVGYQKYNFVFFPLYPMIIASVSKIFSLPVLIAGILLSLTFSFLAMVMLVKLTSLDFKVEVKFLPLILLAFFPTNYYFQSVYSTSLILFLVVASFWLARRKKWFWSSCLASLSIVSHITALAIAPALFAEWYTQKRKWYRFVPYLLIMFTGLVGYMTYLQIWKGDYLLFMHSFAAWDRDKIVFPLQVVYRYLKIFILVSPKLLVYWIAVLEFVGFMSALVLSIYALVKVRFSYGIYAFSILLLSSLSGSFIGLPRYLLYIFPIFLVLSKIISKHKFFKVLLLGLFTILGLILTALFTRGWFVA